MTDIKNVSEILRGLREKNGLKSKFIAEKLGVTPGTYSEIETGKRKPRVEHLLILRNLYHVSLDDLFFNNEIAKCDQKSKQEVI
ncbi:helix-turn-helix domain-containing protein [Gracilibacillus sp. D59]|uniref:helix-turn-helix domain-containing protein n=1 Tax=Gracilibacillus sp. D59 TaxID=3457434 RepID=UPI003FCCC05D